MIQFSELDRTVSRIAVANSLLTRVEVNSTLDRHRHLLRGLMRKMSVPPLEASSRRCLLHHITTDYLAAGVMMRLRSNERHDAPSALR